MFSDICVHADHDVTTFEVEGIIQNLKNWMFWEKWNIIFPWIKKNYASKATFFSESNNL